MKFEQLIRTNKDARKIFGKKEIKIITKQLEGIRLTQSEKNRLSRDIRPKLRFVKEANKFADEFELKKNSSNIKLVQKAVKLILNDKLKENIKAILLFGSHVDGSVTPRSDIDICVVFKKNISLKEATRFRIRISREFPKKVDIQVFNTLPQKVKRSIARNHRVLHKSKDFDNMSFTIRYLKDNDYFIRMDRIFAGV